MVAVATMLRGLVGTLLLSSAVVSAAASAAGINVDLNTELEREIETETETELEIESETVVPPQQQQQQLPPAAVTTESGPEIPPGFDAPFGSYPNLLGITRAERESFHPVVVFPGRVLANLAIKDHRRSSGELAPPGEIASRRRRRNRREALLRCLPEGPRALLGTVRGVWRRARGAFGAVAVSSFPVLAARIPPSRTWGIGKYDENRDGGMYESELFDDLNHTIDGFGGRRTIHLGIDLGGPVGTPVHAFCGGTVHSVGYNPELGDYGYAVIVEHVWGGDDDDDDDDDNGIETETENDNEHETKTPTKRCWALYGHLDASVLASLKPGDAVERGKVLGRMGDIDENGGWISSHLHFQLSARIPDQPHDMPGAASRADRIAALRRYPDPRYVLGPLY